MVLIEQIHVRLACLFFVVLTFCLIKPPGSLFFQVHVSGGGGGGLLETGAYLRRRLTYLFLKLLYNFNTTLNILNYYISIVKVAFFLCFIGREHIT